MINRNNIDKKLIDELDKMRSTMISDRETFCSSLKWRSAKVMSEGSNYAVQINGEHNDFDIADKINIKPVITDYTVNIKGLYFYKEGVNVNARVYGLNKTDKAYLLLLDILFILSLNGIDYKDVTITIYDSDKSIVGSWHDLDYDLKTVIDDYDKINSRLCKETLNYMVFKKLGDIIDISGVYDNIINRTLKEKVDTYYNDSPYYLN